MPAIVIFAVGSAIVVELIETCRRLGQPVAAYVRNYEGPHYVPDGLAVTELDDLPEDVVRLDCLCPLFTPVNRHSAVRQASALGFTFGTTIVDPTAIVAADLVLGAGSFVNAGVVIGAATRIGRHGIVNRSASIGHHNQIDDFVSIGPGAILAGQISLGRGVMIGAGAIVGPGVTIGAHAVVGAGSLVLRDVPAGYKMFGSPAKPVATDLPGFVDA